jgi:hypothetical protein
LSPSLRATLARAGWKPAPRLDPAFSFPAPVPRVKVLRPVRLRRARFVTPSQESFA